MAEDNDHDGAEQTNDELISGLDEGDIKPNFYEGGFKTWECALDLAKRVVDGGGQSEHGELRVIEVGSETPFCSMGINTIRLWLTIMELESSVLAPRYHL